MKVIYQNSLFNIREFKEKDFYGSSPGVFVGRFNYPYLNIGILAPPRIIKDVSFYDSPKLWNKEEFSQTEVINLRSSLINSRFKTEARNPRKYIDIAQEASMSLKGIDLEIGLKKKPFIKTNLHKFNAPTGPKAELVKARVTSNVKVDAKVDKVVDDTDLKAEEAINYLYQKGFEESFLTKLISTANIGLKKNRKLVPTRWSITAVDDIIGKNMINKIKDFSILDKPRLYQGGLFGNYYFIMMFPEVWGYELYEKKHNNHWTDHEFYGGRKTYAFDTAGGYYANRLSILEELKRLRKQATIFCLRIVTEEYGSALGVWVCREATRNAMKKFMEFEDENMMVNFLRTMIKSRFNVDVEKILKESKILGFMKEQKKLYYYL